MKIKTVAAMALGAVLLSGCIGIKGEKTVLPENAVLLDVRSAEEFAAGHLAGAVLLPHDEIGARISAVVPDKSTPVYIYCRSGRRSAIARDEMKALGYAAPVDLGGMEEAAERLR